MRRAAQIVIVAMVVLLLGAEFFARHPYDYQFREEISAAPSSNHLLGTDAVGRDRFSRLLYGGRLSILLAPAAAMVSVAIAVMVALGAALGGSWCGRAATTLIDLFLSLPWLFLLLAVRAMLPLNTSPAVSIGVVFLLLGFLGWAGPARVLLASTKRQLSSEYALLARAGGMSDLRLALRHIVPNLAPVTKAQFWTTAPAYLLSEANLAILGLGVSEPLPSWGNLLRELQNFASLPQQPWLLAPLACLVLLLSCCQLARPADEYSV